MDVFKKILGIQNEGVFRLVIVSFFLYSVVVFQFENNIDNYPIPLNPSNIENFLRNHLFYTTVVLKPFTEFELKEQYVQWRKEFGYDSDGSFRSLGKTYEEWYEDITTPPTVLNQRLRGESFIYKRGWNGNYLLSTIIFILMSFLLVIRSSVWVIGGFKK